MFNVSVRSHTWLSCSDFLNVQGSVIRMIILHVRVAHLCMCSCMINHTMLKHTSSNRARAEKVCRA